MTQLTPHTDRPHMPGYGIQPLGDGQNLLPWSRASERLAEARNYWLATTRPDGRPHAVPIWGIWLDETFYFGVGRSSVKGRNLAHNPVTSLHLESGDDVLILEGSVSEVTDRDLLWRVYTLYGEKYSLDMSANAEEGAEPTFALRPVVAFAWLEHDFPNTATRYTFSKQPVVTE